MRLRVAFFCLILVLPISSNAKLSCVNLISRFEPSVPNNYPIELRNALRGLELSSAQQEYIRVMVNSFNGFIEPRSIERLIYNLYGTTPSGNGRLNGPPSKLSPRDPPHMRASLDAENVVSEVFAKNGYDVVRNPDRIDLDYTSTAQRRTEIRQLYSTARSRDGLVTSSNMQPDLIIEGKIFDVFTPRNPQAHAIYNGIAEKVSRGQTARVVLNLVNLREFNTWTIKLIRDQITAGLKDPAVQAQVRKIQEVKAVIPGRTGPQIVQIWPN